MEIKWNITYNTVFSSSYPIVNKYDHKLDAFGIVWVSVCVRVLANKGCTYAARVNYIVSSKIAPHG